MSSLSCWTTMDELNMRHKHGEVDGEWEEKKTVAIINQGSRLEHLKKLIHTKMCGSISVPLIRILEL